MSQLGPSFASYINVNSPILIFVASVVEMSVSADFMHNTDNTDRVKWAVACGAVSTFICLCILLLMYVRVPFVGTIAGPAAIFLVSEVLLHRHLHACCAVS